MTAREFKERVVRKLDEMLDGDINDDSEYLAVKEIRTMCDRRLRELQKESEV